MPRDDWLSFFIDNGASVIPLKKNDKKPAIKWKKHTEEKLTREEIEEVLQREDSKNIGVICGGVSDNLLVLDIDKAELFEKLNLGEIAAKTLTVKTAKGYHIYLRIDDPELDKWIGEKGVKTLYYPPKKKGQDEESHEEIRFQWLDHYVVGPGSVHPSGAIYEHLATSPKEIKKAKNVDLLEEIERRWISYHKLEDKKGEGILKEPLLDFIKRYITPKEVLDQGDYIQMWSPFHKGTSPNAFTIYKSDNHWYDFSEEIGGRHPEFLMRFKDISKKEAYDELGLDLTAGRDASTSIPLKYADKDFGTLELEKTKDGKHILVTIRNGDKLEVFDAKKPLDFYLSEKIRDSLFGFIKSELNSDEYNAFLEEVILKIEDILKLKEKEEGKEEKKEVKYSSEEKEKAQQLLRDSFLIQKIKIVLDFKFAGLNKKKLEFFLNCLSKDLEPKRRTSPHPYGKWGEGKSVFAESGLSLFDFERMNSARLPSVYRKALIKQNYYDEKILYFGDLGEGVSDEFKEVLDIFKQLMSEGEVVRDIMMKEGDEYVPVELKLTGYPILVWTAQAPPSDPQHLSRVMPYNIDVSKEQRERVREFSSYEEDTPQELRYPSEIKELERTIKTAIEILKENRKPILNPFAHLINTCMSIESPNVNRDRYKFFSLVASITHLYHFQRETIKIKDQEYLITSPIDVLYAIYLGEEDFRVLFGSLDAISQRAYNIIKEKKEPIKTSLSLLKARAKDKIDKDDSAVAINELENKSFTNSDVEDWLNVSYKTVARITRNLFKKSVLARDKKGREYQFYLLSEGSKAKTNGVILFDSRRMLEGLMDESTIAKWVNRLYSHEPLHTHTYICEQKKLLLSPDDLDNIYVPDAKIDVDVYIPLWGGSGEYNETEQPQTFKYLTENGNYLRDSRRTLEESSPIEIKKIILEVGKCKACGKEEADLYYVVYYPNDELFKVCEECGKRIMKDFGLKLIGGDKQ